MRALKVGETLHGLADSSSIKTPSLSRNTENGKIQRYFTMEKDVPYPNRRDNFYTQ